ncbi:hypothetical protein SRB5_13410 [Streptomyces sp. RB5]|uniref:Uncharacterized protein n=1 Tax=Streptomyces smaragdinus TaxID=2585196 RepID=A0A7K0CCY1_9ACTN|nr:hypothetical protein [Streptomyces smaragdinus]MQY11226.1 hypothetical protein [Streptomyces smaragdinus]
MTNQLPPCGGHPWRPAWIPEAGHRLRLAGVYFDVVRVDGVLGALVLDALVREARGPAGGVVYDCAARRFTFLAGVRSAGGRRWPPGSRAFAGGRGRAEYVGIPALRGRTWPLAWCSVPVPEAPLVDADLLHGLLCRTTGWQPDGG